MGTLALSWSIAALSALVAAVSAVRVVTTSGESRYAAGGDLLMGLCMAAMALPATAAWYGGHGMWWSGLFALLGLGAVVLAVKHTREYGWKEGRHWVHLIVGSAGMVIMTLAMTTTSSGPVLALGSGHGHGSAMPGMPDMEDAAGMHHSAGMEGMAGIESSHGAGAADMSGHASAAGADASSSSSLWRFVIAALAVYFLLSIAASVWARARGTDRTVLTAGRENGRRRSWGRWLLSMPDTVVVYLASLTLSVWDKARTTERGRHGGRRRRTGATPEAALAAHVGMGGTMSAMLLMMVA
ncbi:DUF5134 domain-containing protein [Streptomyces aurantiogriseus]|uniref:Aromatic ring-opening dioxygenase LigA n=1 Tax=Streptomyces aurantiogriseus TaxID=66870 RepID=A0A918CKE3_9ACTN|nr:DUF5134 domain-containing protein [Streptomyces aurantiogriseus]GGR27638.1 hypothetical protein GCM10010251_49500 [Streptomyces aurantiogriseus]